MWYCNNCKNEFAEPEKQKESFEEFYGVSNLFQTSNYFEHLTCPECGDDDIEEMQMCDYCGKWNLSENLEDTDEMINGGIGYLCSQCLQDCDIK